MAQVSSVRPGTRPDMSPACKHEETPVTGISQPAHCLLLCLSGAGAYDPQRRLLAGGLRVSGSSHVSLHNRPAVRCPDDLLHACTERH